MDRVKSLGYNTIRLPFSNELVESNPIVTQHVRANPEFLGRHAMFVLDGIVRYAHRIGLKIILDDHVSSAMRDNMVNVLLEPLWYTARYSESSWIRDWQMLARRYKGNDAVVGFDLRNEPHTNGPGVWDLHGYLTRGSTWGPYRGVDNPSTDWRLAAARAGNAILRINPRLLIFVEGLQLYPDASAPYGTDTYWWGSNLSMVRNYPVILHVPHQLVYETHDWGPWKWNMPWFRDMTYVSLQRVWHQKWSYLLDNPNAPYAAPVWVGEFGTQTSNPAAIDQQEPGNQATWFHLLLRFLSDNKEVGWGFWALNGTNARNSATNNGILNPAWNGVANAALQADLASIQGD
jgi:endoglucanase